MKSFVKSSPIEQASTDVNLHFRAIVKAISKSSKLDELGIQCSRDAILSFQLYLIDRLENATLSCHRQKYSFLPNFKPMSQLEADHP